MIPRYHILRERIAVELADVRRAADKAIAAYHQAERDSRHTTFFLDSVAINLHTFYSGVERIFEGIARELDGGLPAGPTRHRELLTQMILDVPGLRPAVVRRETAQALAEYMRFRHLVRNLYTWNFETQKLADLVAGLPQVLADLQTDLTAFGRFLLAAGAADELEGGAG